MDVEARTAKKWQVTRASPSKRRGTALGATRKLPRLDSELPGTRARQLGIQQFLTMPRKPAEEDPGNTAVRAVGANELPI